MVTIPTSENIIIYLGIPIFVFGIIGAVFNIIIFLGTNMYRKNSCAFYLAIMSFFNIGQLINGLFSRIMIDGFHIDLTHTSLVYCKFRWFFCQLCTSTAFTCLCLATIDKYFATSSNLGWRRYSNIQLARHLCTISCLIWTLHGIPFIMYYNHILIPDSSKNNCVITNIYFQRYFVFCYVLILSSCLPIMISITFGVLIYRNTQPLGFQIVCTQPEIGKQLINMILAQVIYNFFAAMPYTFTMILSIQPYVLNLPIAETDSSLVSVITACFYHLVFSVSIIR